jgi:hypothetical protein
VLAGTGVNEIQASIQEKVTREKGIDGSWNISISTSEQYPSFEPLKNLDHLLDFSQVEILPAFSGTFRYVTSFEWTEQAHRILLDLGKVFETVEVWVNGQSVGTRICPPYRLDIGGLVRVGKNILTIEVTNTLVKEQRDFLSRFAQQESSGLLGPVRLLY